MVKDVKKIALKIVNYLQPYCKRIKVAGSIRRKEKNPGDIDIVLIPKDKENVEEALRKKGRFVEGGEIEAVFKIGNVKVELYYTVEEEWGACLLAYSSEKGASIGLRKIAREKGFTLNQHGLFKNGMKVAGRTEREIYEKLERKWKPADQR